MQTGYSHSAYAEIYSAFGNIRELEDCGGWILEREVPGTFYTDAMGLYPLFCCSKWEGLAASLDQLRSDLVSLVIVTDPFSPFDEQELRKLFSYVIPFKDHYVADLARPVEKILSKSRLRAAERALEMLDVDIYKGSEIADECLAVEWSSLYQQLSETKRISGMPASEPEAIAQLFRVPGLVVFRASRAGQVLGMHLEFLQSGGAVYGHLAAYSAEGKRLGAASALTSERD